VLLGIAFAFVPVEERGLDEWMVNFFKAVYQINQRVWKKEPSQPTAFLYENISMVRQELITLAPTTSRRKLEQYLTHQKEAQGVDPLDMPEQAYIAKIHEAYANMPATKTTVTVAEPIVEAPTIEDVPSAPIEPTKPQEPSKEKPERKAEKPAKEEKIKKAEPRGRRIKKTPRRTLEIVKSTKFTDDAGFSGALLMPITPDRHSGRKFTNLLSGEGHIILPIRGERVLAVDIDTENTLEKDAKEKAEQLRKYLEQVKQSEGIQISSDDKEKRDKKKSSEKDAPAEKPSSEQSVQDEAETVILKLQEEKIELTEKIEKLKKEVQKTPERKKEKKEKKKVSLRQLIDTRTKKERTLRELEERVHSLAPEDALPTTPAKEAHAETIPAPTSPNIIAGLVAGPTGAGIPNTLLIIKNAHNDPVRAIKTNSLGHFSITGPLISGEYKVFADINKETGFTFDIINVEATGNVIPSLKFLGKV